MRFTQTEKSFRREKGITDDDLFSRLKEINNCKFLDNKCFRSQPFPRHVFNTFFLQPLTDVVIHLNALKHFYEKG